MAKPAEYREAYALVADVPYRNAGKASSTETHASKGVLQRGRVVWSQPQLERSEAAACITVYAEGVGIIDLPLDTLLLNQSTARETVRGVKLRSSID